MDEQYRKKASFPFIYGHVDPECFPVDQLSESARNALQTTTQPALNYNPLVGSAPLRDYLRERISRDEDLNLELNELILTGGASAGLDLALRTFTKPGDTVLVEAPCYHEALALIRDYPVKLAAIPLDQRGIRVDTLAERLAKLAQAGERPSLIYLIPTFQNPSGITMSTERRLEVLELAQLENLLVIEDDVYRDLYYESVPPPSLFALQSPMQRVIRLGSFSKILAPGFRLGWAMGSAELMDAMSNTGLSQSSGGANPLSAHIALAFCNYGWLDPHVEHLREIYRKRRNTTLKALDAFMPDSVRWNRPRGGFFIWITLPDPLTAKEVLHETEKHGVTFLPGEPFFAEREKSEQRHIRFSFSFVHPSKLALGVEILSNVIKDQLRVKTAGRSIPKRPAGP